MTEGGQASYQRKFNSLLRLSELVSSSLRIQDVLDNAMKALEECLNAQDSSIYEIDYEKQELFFRLARGDKGRDLVARRLPIGEGVAGWVAQTGRPKIVQKAEDEALYHDRFDKELGYTTRSMLTAPLFSKGAVVGVVQVLNKKDGPFTQEDLELCRIMAGQIAMALENAKLFTRLEEKQQDTEAELAETQKRLIISQRQAALAGLIQGVAHQLRNPSMAIGGFARRIKKKTAEEEIAEYAEVITDETSRIERLVRQVVFLADINPQFEPTNPADLIPQAVKQTDLETNGPVIETLTSENLPRLQMDPALMVKALEEALKNALEAQSTLVAVSAFARRDQVCFTVEDDGRGMDKETVQSAFDPFYSTHADQPGLGLAVVHRIMTVHDGQAHLESEPEKGTTITLCLPMQQKFVS
jgi:K+-sensing histidine kinase KdpD